MVDGFKVEVPITLKGGREGEKVGKQIGEKIAAQLKKTLGTIGIGGKAKGAGTGVEAAGMLGVSKGLKGVATKLGVIGLAIGATVGLLKKSSPYLKGILDIFGRAFMIFFRPFGDFLATLLRPLAILMMKMAVAFIKWTRPISGKVREAVAEVPQIPLTGLKLVDFAIEIGNWALKIGAALGAVVFEIGRAAFGLGAEIGQWLLDYVIFPAGDFLASKIYGMWIWTQDFAGWLWGQVTTIWNWTKDFSKWLWDKITSIWEWEGRSFGGWLWDKITSIWTWKWDFGSWLWDKIRSILPGGRGGEEKGYQVGTPFVQSEGLYKLHRGEEVVSRTKAGTNRSVIFKPTFQISGTISQDIDMDAIVRRAGRMTEMDLKQRGII